jgi:hypothetical protein
MITNDASGTRKSKSRTAMAKTAFYKKKTVFMCKLDLILRKKLQKGYIWRITLYGAENLDTSERSSEIPGEILNVVLENDGDQLDQSCEK